MSSTAFDEMIAAVGSQAELARRVNALVGPGDRVSEQAVSKWRKSIPSNRVLILEQITGVSRHRQRPDVFGVDPSSGPRELGHARPPMRDCHASHDASALPLTTPND